MDLCALNVNDPQQLIQEISKPLRACRSMEEASALLSRTLYNNCISGPEPERSLVLVRVYLSLPFSWLESDSQVFTRRALGLEPDAADLFLVLVGTWGDQPAWRDRMPSRGYRTIPLHRKTITSVPMLARSFRQIGFDRDLILKAEQGIFLEGQSNSLGLFYVQDASRSPDDPAQSVATSPYGVRTVIWSGTLLPNGAASVLVGFARHQCSQSGAIPLATLMPAFWELVQSIYQRTSIFNS